METRSQTTTYGGSAIPGPTGGFKITDEMQTCISACLDCFRICTQAITHCLSKGGRHAAPEHISYLRACADICETAASFMMMVSEFHRKTCAVCAEVCNACAADCESMADDEMMRVCADACRRCAESCVRMSSPAH